MAILHVDKNRLIQKEASPDKITGEWREVVDEIVETCKSRLGSRLISLYIGGSVSTGNAVRDKSDVDSYAVVDMGKEEIEEAEGSWVKEERKRIHSQFPFLRGVEIHFSPVSSMSEGRKFQLKVLAALVYGKDFSAELPEYRLNKETLGRVRVNVAKDINKARKELADASDPKTILRISKWIPKRLIRSAGMLVLWKGDVFSMEIPFLTDLISSQYPEQKQAFEAVIRLANEGSEVKEDTLAVLDDFGEWLIGEDKRVFG